MECVLQWLDDLEDLVCAVMLSGGTIRRLCRSFAVAMIAFGLQAAIILLAFTSPPAAVASGSLLVVGVLYHGAVYRRTSDVNPGQPA